CTVAHQGVCADGAAVLKVFEDFKPLLDHFVAGLVLDVGDHADAAGIVFVFGIVETLCRRPSRIRAGGGLACWRLVRSGADEHSTYPLLWPLRGLMQWRQSRRGADTASRGSYEVRSKCCR